MPAAQPSPRARDAAFTIDRLTSPTTAPHCPLPRHYRRPFLPPPGDTSPAARAYRPSSRKHGGRQPAEQQPATCGGTGAASQLVRSGNTGLAAARITGVSTQPSGNIMSEAQTPGAPPRIAGTRVDAMLRTAVLASTFLVAAYVLALPACNWHVFSRDNEDIAERGLLLLIAVSGLGSIALAARRNNGWWLLAPFVASGLPIAQMILLAWIGLIPH